MALGLSDLYVGAGVMLTLSGVQCLHLLCHLRSPIPLVNVTDTLSFVCRAHSITPVFSDWTLVYRSHPNAHLTFFGVSKHRWILDVTVTVLFLGDVHSKV